MKYLVIAFVAIAAVFCLGCAPAGKAYTLTVTKIGEGVVEVRPEALDFADGTVVELTALPSPGWAFGGWSGDADGMLNPRPVLMDADKTITALFTQEVHVHTVDTTG